MLSDEELTEKELELQKRYRIALEKSRGNDDLAQLLANAIHEAVNLHKLKSLHVEEDKKESG